MTAEEAKLCPSSSDVNIIIYLLDNEAPFGVYGALTNLNIQNQIHLIRFHDK